MRSGQDITFDNFWWGYNQLTDGREASFFPSQLQIVPPFLMFVTQNKKVDWRYLSRRPEWSWENWKRMGLNKSIHRHLKNVCLVCPLWEEGWKKNGGSKWFTFRQQRELALNDLLDLIAQLLVMWSLLIRWINELMNHLCMIRITWLACHLRHLRFQHLSL